MTTPSLADTITEPADGTRLAMEDADGDLAIIYRDDTATSGRLTGDERWFTDSPTFPATWERITRGGIRLYRLVPVVPEPRATGTIPIAVFSSTH